MPTTGRTAAAAVVGAVVVLLSGCSSDTPVSLAGTGGSVGTTAEASASASAAAGADATMQLADPTAPPSTKAAAVPSPRASAAKKAAVKKASPAATASRRSTVAASPSTASGTSPKPTPKASPPTPAPSVSPTKPAGGGGGTTSTVDEAAVVALTNAERAKNGCGPLTVNATLTTVARAHSKDMAVNGYFDHNSQDGRTPFDRMKNAGYTYSMAAENIAAGQPTPSSVVTAWMNSEGHRANILNCKLTQIGVGLYRLPGSPYGVYWTQDFGTPR